VGYITKLVIFANIDSPNLIKIAHSVHIIRINPGHIPAAMARFPYPEWEDKNFAAAGKRTINVFKLLSYSPATVEQWTSIGNAHFTKISHTKKNRELIILLSSAKFGSIYEWTHHIPLSTKFGITDKQREELLSAGKVKGYFSERYWERNEASFNQEEQVLLTFLEVVIDSGEVDEATWQMTTRTFSERQIMEIITMQVSPV
jgi:alkylhydroperoxidase family enzyme